MGGGGQALASRKIRFVAYIKFLSRKPVEKFRRRCEENLKMNLQKNVV